jgi:hypothetical protein
LSFQCLRPSTSLMAAGKNYKNNIVEIWKHNAILRLHRSIASMGKG